MKQKRHDAGEIRCVAVFRSRWNRRVKSDYGRVCYNSERGKFVVTTERW